MSQKFNKNAIPMPAQSIFDKLVDFDKLADNEFKVFKQMCDHLGTKLEVIRVPTRSVCVSTFRYESLDINFDQIQTSVSSGSLFCESVCDGSIGSNDLVIKYLHYVTERLLKIVLNETRNRLYNVLMLHKNSKKYTNPSRVTLVAIAPIQFYKTEFSYTIKGRTSFGISISSYLARQIDSRCKYCTRRINCYFIDKIFSFPYCEGHLK